MRATPRRPPPRRAGPTWLALAALWVAAPQAPPAAAQTVPEAAARATLNEADRRFLIDASAAGVYEVAAAKLAEQRAQHPSVKVYAAMLVKDHSTINDELGELARVRAVLLPDAMPAERQKMVEALDGLSAAVFDRRFIEQVGIAEHQADVVLFEAAARSANDPELRAWAARTLPRLKDHLAAAQQIPLTVPTTFVARRRPGEPG